VQSGFMQNCDKRAFLFDKALLGHSFETMPFSFAAIRVPILSKKEKI
jgi:hypothetical protein